MGQVQENRSDQLGCRACFHVRLYHTLICHQHNAQPLPEIPGAGSLQITHHLPPLQCSVSLAASAPSPRIPSQNISSFCIPRSSTLVICSCILFGFSGLGMITVSTGDFPTFLYIIVGAVVHLFRVPGVKQAVTQEPLAIQLHRVNGWHGTGVHARSTVIYIHNLHY